jgi:hypothetical protein
MPEPTSNWERVNVLANCIIAGGVWIALLAYWGSERTARLQETLKFVYTSPATTEVERGDLFIGMIDYFPERYKYPENYPIKTCLTPERAKSLFDVSAKPKDPLYDEYNTARKHLNSLVPISFAYVQGIGDRRILAEDSCVSLVRSYKYFATLIDEFHVFGSQQSWQVIRQAVRQMSADYPELCTEPPAQDSRWNTAPAVACRALGYDAVTNPR